MRRPLPRVVSRTAVGLILATWAITGVAGAAAPTSCSNPTIGVTVPVPDVGDLGPSLSTWSPAGGPSSCDVAGTSVTGASLTVGGSPVVQLEGDGPHFVLNLKVQLVKKADGSVLGETSLVQDVPVATWLSGTVGDPGLPSVWPVSGLYSSASIPLSASSLDASCVASGVGLQGSYSCALYSN